MLRAWLAQHRNALLLALACVLSRLPQLLNSQSILDGDECIVALMAKHLLEQGEVSAYFWGQAYGFSLLETVPMALLYALLGVGDLAVKLAMLGLWTAGILVFHSTLQQVNPRHRWLPTAVALALVLSPSWAVWSMKARGGYLSAFLLSAVVLRLAWTRATPRTDVLLGVLLVFIFECQPLWLPGLLLVLVVAVWEAPRARLPALLSGAAVTAGLFLLGKQTASRYWQPPGLVLDGKTWVNAQHLPRRLWESQHGFYYLKTAFSPGVASAVLAGAALLLTVALLGVAVGRLRQPKPHARFLAAVGGVVVTAVVPVFLAQEAPRYLLPLPGLLFLSLFLLLDEVGERPWVALALTSACSVGAVALVEFKDFRFDPVNRQRLQASVQRLEDLGVRHVYTPHGLFQWQLIYYSREHILARARPAQDRYPPFVQQVDKAEHVALVGWVDVPADHALENGAKVVLDPDRKMLERLGFRW